MDIIDNFKREVKNILENLKREVQGIRAGRPSASLVENIKVDYHGQETPLNHISSISVKPPREINLQVWEEEMVKKAANAIDVSDLGLTSNIDGNVVKIFLPELSVERRVELIRHVKKIIEEHRIRVRQIREDFNRKVDKLFNDSEITEDDKYKLRDLIQKSTDEANNEMDEIFKRKEEEINE